MTNALPEDRLGQDLYRSDHLLAGDTMAPVGLALRVELDSCTGRQRLRRRDVLQAHAMARLYEC
jgi:hypothetical protein